MPRTNKHPRYPIINRSDKKAPTRIGEGVPLLADGKNGDMIVRRIKKKGLFLFFKYQKQWHNVILDNLTRSMKESEVQYTRDGFQKIGGKGLKLTGTGSFNSPNLKLTIILG